MKDIILLLRQQDRTVEHIFTGGDITVDVHLPMGWIPNGKVGVICQDERGKKVTDGSKYNFWSNRYFPQDVGESIVVSELPEICKRCLFDPSSCKG